MTLSFDVTSDGETEAVVLSGSIDRDAGPQMEAIRSAAGSAAVLELDFSDVDYMNSSGIALLVGLLMRAREVGTTVRATGLTPHYQHIFEITRLNEFMQIVEPAERRGGDHGKP